MVSILDLDQNLIFGIPSMIILAAHTYATIEATRRIMKRAFS